MALVDVANTIAQIEGANVSGSIAQRCNNPGNLVFIGQAGATACPSAPTFASWPTTDQGFSALESQISLDANRGLSVQDFISKYDPVPTETSNYLNLFTQKLSTTPSASLLSLIGGSSGASDSFGNDTTDTTDGGFSLASLFPDLSNVSFDDPALLAIGSVLVIGLFLKLS